MASLIEHMVKLTLYKEQCRESVENDIHTDKLGQFFAEQFMKEAGGTVYRHLEEICLLLPDQTAFAKELAEGSAAFKNDLLPKLRAATRIFDLMKAIGGPQDGPEHKG